ncbi:hypothetical protein [Conexibacter sp. CPCC 206217]|uniref:hypothetical protein n=1 Tax=Conexibacter sp. CPCC 206217 TaxID=3064574 RepID=UPI002725E120|nr:hypothetical protein [Conexibacter sp. CPCC 206217]MDO8210602.1 hypothetical protein [Conexibacter sp. CPCC 206217]
MASYSDPTCGCGVCGSDVPPLIGSVLTGVGMTLAQAARALEEGREPNLTHVQREMVERWAEQQIGAGA